MYLIMDGHSQLNKKFGCCRHSDTKHGHMNEADSECRASLTDILQQNETDRFRQHNTVGCSQSNTQVLLSIYYCEANET